MNELIQAARTSIAYEPLYVAWLVIFLVLERLFPAVEHKSLRGWTFNLATGVLYLTAGTLASGIGALIGGAIKARLGLGLIDLRISHTDTVLGAIAATLLSLLIFDFFYYWWHRSQHRYPALWAIHKLHHLDEAINATTDVRHHWLEDIGRIAAITIPIAILFNLSPEAGGTVGFFFVAWTIFFHANLRLQLGPLSWLINCPQVHRIHHSRLSEHFDRNFAAYFPIWDVLFGTYFHPRRREFPPTGLADEPAVSRIFDGALLPFRTWYRTLLVRPGNSVLPVSSSTSQRTPWIKKS
jgi:sterol desaturase/sphingolipid hydroxylase (fatty acid hydroxylase superfamily)